MLGGWVFIVALHRLSAGSNLQTVCDRHLLPDTKAISGMNFREVQVAHLMVFFI